MGQENEVPMIYYLLLSISEGSFTCSEALPTAIEKSWSHLEDNSTDKRKKIIMRLKKRNLKSFSNLISIDYSMLLVCHYGFPTKVTVVMMGSPPILGYVACPLSYSKVKIDFSQLNWQVYGFLYGFKQSDDFDGF